MCLKIGHFFKECPTAYLKPCHYCKRVGHHNCSLCPKQFIETPQSSETTATTSHPLLTRQHVLTTNQSSTVNKATCANQSPIVNRESSQADATTETTTDTVAPAVNTEHILLTNGEQMLLQTAIVPIYCGNGSIVSACILLDSASQRTFMTEKLAKQLNLPSERKETLSILTFGSQGPQSIDTYVVHFIIITKKGSSMSLHANVLNQITSPIQRGPLQKADLEFLHQRNWLMLFQGQQKLLPLIF